MGLLKDIYSAYKYKKKEHITSEEFIDVFESDFKRDMDEESKLFFRHHDVSVNLLHKIFAGKLKMTGYENEKDNLVIQGFFMDMHEYSIGIDHDALMKSERPISDLLKEFIKIYPDAGYLIGEGLRIFMKLGK